MSRLLHDNGERPFAALTRRVLREELKARTPVQAGNLLSALRHMIGWMIDEEHIEPDDDPTIGLKSRQGESLAARAAVGCRGQKRIWRSIAYAGRSAPRRG